VCQLIDHQHTTAASASKKKGRKTATKTPHAANGTINPRSELHNPMLRNNIPSKTLKINP
jgi:hypothetical protein